MNVPKSEFAIFCDALQMAIQIATKSAGLAARGGPVAAQGTTPMPPGFAPPGGPLGPLQSGLTLHPLATPQGRAQLYITQPDLVRQVETLLDETVETFGEHLGQLLDRLDEQRTQSSSLELVATQLRDLADVVDTAISQAREDREKIRQDLLKLQNKLKLL